ncbi:DUF2000 domain-containing protein [Mycobacterium sp. KBS0706]|uniref:DUF2000 domain-containing protein n=1 Tax=Mycobacterium sp. KBS0706 TaxID=2578109 RepID=UPI001C8F68D6|nr:DUF2000 domain-containing protein [Mycobacterium sp. KBS0706]
MRFDTKIAVALREDLPVWQKLNVAAFTVSGLAATRPELVGAPYEDGSGNLYLPMFRQPVLVFAGPAEALKAAHARALARNLRIAIYTAELFTTGYDDANRAAVKAVQGEALNLVGFAMHEDRKDVDRVLKGLSLHP